MIKVPYAKNRLYDQGLDFIINNIREATSKRNDDFLLVACGMTGTGKSSLLMHIYEKLVGLDNMDLDVIAFEKEGLAAAIKKASETNDRLRLVLNDEANISKRNALSKFNKDLLDLYFACRGLNIAHLWANPSIDILDKAFITERVNGLIFVATKDMNRPRLYYYFLKKDLLTIFNRYGTLKMDLLKKVAKRYAYYRGWFKPYNSPMWQEYNNKKQNRMKNKVDDFLEKYGAKEQIKLFGTTEVAKMLSYTNTTIDNWFTRLKDQGLFIEDMHYIILPTGKKKFTEDGITKLEREMIASRKAGEKE